MQLIDIFVFKNITYAYESFKIYRFSFLCVFLLFA